MDYIKDFAKKIQAYNCTLIVNEPNFGYENNLQDKCFYIKKGNKQLFSIQCDVKYHFETSLNDWIFKGENGSQRFKNLEYAFDYCMFKLENSLAIEIKPKQTLLQKIKRFLGVKK